MGVSEHKNILRQIINSVYGINSMLNVGDKSICELDGNSEEWRKQRETEEFKYKENNNHKIYSKREKSRKRTALIFEQIIPVNFLKLMKVIRPNMEGIRLKQALQKRGYVTEQ